jgi:hypothetical protein
MSRHSAGVKTSAGSTTLPVISLYSAAATGSRLREVGLFNTTTTAVDVKLVRLTSAGTQGASITEAEHDPDGAPPLCIAYTTHSVAPSLGDDLGYRASLAGAVGSGIIWTFGDQGIRAPVGTGNGIGVIVENGTGQALQAYLVWDE